MAALRPRSAKPSSTIVAAGLLATLTADIWGWAKDLLLYVKPTTLRVTANGYAVLTRRASIQQVIYDFITYYQSQVAAYQAHGNYPMNGPVEIRVTGLDKPLMLRSVRRPFPAAVGIASPTRSARWDVAVWFDILTMPGTPSLGSVLPRDRTVDVQQLQRVLCHGSA